MFYSVLARLIWRVFGALACAERIILGIFVVLLAVIWLGVPVVMAEDYPDHVAATSWRVVDGDTIHTGDHKIRLLGIDAPEMRQNCKTKHGDDWPCGLMARDIVVGMFDASGALWCRITGRDRYQRLLGQCFAGTDASGIDVQHVLVRSGFAVAEYSRDYKTQEAEAKRGKQGVWRGDFLRPKDWRRRQ